MEAMIPTESASPIQLYELLYIMQTPSDFSQADVRWFCWTAPKVYSDQRVNKINHLSRENEESDKF